MNPDISIVIPCFNQGHFLKDALDSIAKADVSNVEVIIVNDGSTDRDTNVFCDELKATGHHVIMQPNQGLSAARNTGIRAAKGRYILPLDSDNRVLPPYLKDAPRILDEHPDVAVVYADALYFGEKKGLWQPGPFNMQKLMLSNTIDACALIRRSVFDAVGDYDTNMKLGWEDWELWLRIAFSGYGFYYLSKPGFEYRVSSNSMSKTLYSNYERPNSIENYIHQKHPSRMGQQFIVEHYVRRFKKSPFLFLIKLFLRAFFPAYYQRLLQKNKIRNGL